MYTVCQKRIKNTSSWSYRYCEERATLAWHLYNAALFRIRQIFTGWDKPAQSENEKEVFSEVDMLEKAYPDIHVRRVISYTHLEKLMRVTENPDFFTGLPMQTAQAVVRQAVQDFKTGLRQSMRIRRIPPVLQGSRGYPIIRRHPVRLR